MDGTAGERAGTGTNGHVMVFAPTPLLTVTVDQPAGQPEIHLHPGGQGSGRPG